MGEFLKIFFTGLLVCAMGAALVGLLFGLFLLGVAYPWVGWTVSGFVMVMIVGMVFSD